MKLYLNGEMVASDRPCGVLDVLGASAASDMIAWYESQSAPILTTANITDIGTDSATCGGKITEDNGRTITAQVCVWNTASNHTVDSCDGKTTDSGNPFVSNLTGLRAQTSYCVRAYATNAQGETGYGEQRVFTTTGSGMTPPGNALSFDGTDDYAEIPHAWIGNPGGSFTIECWARLDSGVGIADGSTAISAENGTDFGGVTIGGSTVAHTFTIENTGAGPLDFADSPAVTLAGTGAIHFAVSAQPALDPVPIDGSTTFQVTFDPFAGGVHTATVGIASNDPDESPYTFDIQGTGRAPGFTVVESDGSTEVSETGTQDTFTAVLDAQPESDVVITVVSADTGEATASPATLTFAPEDWNIEQTVTVTGVDDMIVDGDQTTLVTLSVDDALSEDLFDPLADRTVTVTTEDDVADHLKGDVNGDGVVTLDDAVLALEIVCGVDTGDTLCQYGSRCGWRRRDRDGRGGVCSPGRVAGLKNALRHPGRFGVFPIVKANLGSRRFYRPAQSSKKSWSASI